MARSEWQRNKPHHATSSFRFRRATDALEGRRALAVNPVRITIEMSNSCQHTISQARSLSAGVSSSLSQRPCRPFEMSNSKQQTSQLSSLADPLLTKRAAVEMRLLDNIEASFNIRRKQSGSARMCVSARARESACW